MSKSATLSRKISLVILLMVVFSTTIVGFFSYQLHRRDSVSFSSQKALSIAQTTASAIDGDQFMEIMQTMEKSDHWYQIKNYADNVKLRTGVLFLYILDATYDQNVTYFVEGTIAGEEENTELGEKETISVHADEMFETMKTGQPSTTDIYDAEEYGTMVSGFAPITNGSNKVVGVVGVDIGIDDVMHANSIFGMLIIMGVIIFSVLFWLVSNWYIVRRVGRPISLISNASKKIAIGDMEINLDYNSNDEIGLLTQSFMEMVKSTKKHINILEKLAAGDLTSTLVLRSNADSMGKAMQKTLFNLNRMLKEVRNAANQVDVGATHISDGAQILAQGSSEQAGAVEMLVGTLNTITQKAEKTTNMARSAAELSGEIRRNAQKGSRHMDDMMVAVQDINRAGQSIEKVIKVIDDIAFQTNILALNASVEAARAGQHGKGFAVVAEEVRNLASKSAEAAKETSTLIANSIEKARLGSDIANQTATSLTEIVDGINQSSSLISDIAQYSEQQANEITGIITSVEQVSEVVQRTSATAQESAAASQQMNGQANMLNSLVEQFIVD